MIEKTVIKRKQVRQRTPARQNVVQTEVDTMQQGGQIVSPEDAQRKDGAGRIWQAPNHG